MIADDCESPAGIKFRQTRKNVAKVTEFGLS